MLESSKTYCAFLFREISIRPNGQLTPCCRTLPIPGESANNIKRAWNSEYMNNLRQMSLNNVPIDQCSLCYLDEKHGKKSMRQDGLRNYGTPLTPELKGLHLSLSNLCNIKCRHCGHHSSSKWYSDAEKMQMPVENTALLSSNFNFHSVDLNKINTMHFYGGEPFLHHEELTEILEFKKTHGTLETLYIAIGTNGTTHMPTKLLNLIAQAGRVWFAFSIDAIGAFGEYFRSGTKWDFVKENINIARDKFKNKPNIKIGSKTTITIYNINVLKDVENFLYENWPFIIQQKTALSWPRPLSATNLPEAYKNIIRTRHQTDSYWDRYTLNLLNEKPRDTFHNFIEWHKKLDNIRNENLENCNPELADWIKESSKT